MQNCINEERVASVAGWGRTLGVIVGGGVGVELYEPGHIRRGYAKRPDATGFYVGEPNGRITARAEQIAAMINDVDNCKATDNLWGDRWTKLCVNAMRNGVSAATGMGGNDRDRHDAVRRVCIKLGGEAVRVGQALGYKLGKVGALPPEKLARAVGRRTRCAGRSRSLHARRRRGRRTRGVSAAVDGAGHGQGPPHRDRVDERLHRRGRCQAGVPAPTNAMITRQVLRVERGEIPPRPENVLVNS